MFVLHGVWAHDGGLNLWAENSSLRVTSQKQAVWTLRDHPFAAGDAELRGLLGPALETMGLPEADAGGGPSEILMGLPSLARSPLDSPELIRVRARPAAPSQPAILPWRIPTLHLSAHGASLVLGDLAMFEVLLSASADIRLGASLGFLAKVAELARHLAARGRVVPSLDIGKDERHRATWRPVLQGPDLTAMHALIGAMPPVARAQITEPTDLGGSDPGDLTAACLAELVDDAVRSRAEVHGVGALDAAPKRRGRRPATMPAAEGWLAALTDRTGTAPGSFHAEESDAWALADALEPWEEFATGPLGSARALFRLAENHDGAPWRLEFWLQSVQDPTLMVSAEQVWEAGAALARWLERPEELLLRELGRAAGIYPVLARALRGATPTAAELDTAVAHEFLTGYTGLLEQAGFGLLLPSWWSGRRRLQLRGRATPSTEGGATEGMLTRDTLYGFTWDAAIDGDALTEEEFQALAATKEPLVRFRGEWVAIDPEQIARVQAFITERASVREEFTAAEVIAMAGERAPEAPVDIAAIEAGGLLGDLLDGRLATTLQPVEIPAGISATLRPYQERGLAWLSFLTDLGLGACLADDMGLGKTLQLLSLEASMRERGQQGPTLLLCPMTLIGNWQREAAKFAPHLIVYAHHGPDRARGRELEALVGAADIVITTYHTAARDLEELAGFEWQRLVMDEAQAVKNHLARTSKAVRRIRAHQRIALTGTPMENKLLELWSIMDLLNPGILGSVEAFRAKYATPIERYGDEQAAARLRRITQPYILRRVKTDPAIAPDLPAKIETKEYCRLTLEQASLYQAVLSEMMTKIESTSGIERRGNVLATMTKLKQVCNHPAQLLQDASPIGTRSGKVERLHEILGEILESGEKVLLFTQYREFAQMLLPHIAARHGVDVAYLHGGTSKKARDELVGRFQDPGGPPVFLLSLKAGGTGLTLTEASHVIHLDRWWNPAVEDQATDRAFRIGQTKNVQVHKLIATGTLEEHIDDMIEQKKALADLVVGGGEAWLTDLSTEELRELFALSQGVGDD